MVGLRHDAGIVVEAIQAAVRCERVIHHRPGIGFLRHIGADERRLATAGPNESHGLLASRLAVFGDDHLGAFCSEHLCGHSAHPAAAAGDDRDLALESHGTPLS